MEKKYGKVFVINYEAYYTLLEKPMPTKFMRYASYEDFLIDHTPGGCEAVKEAMLKEGYKHIIEKNPYKIKASQEFISWLIRVGPFMPQHKDRMSSRERGDCAAYIMQELTTDEPIDLFRVKVHTVPWGEQYYVDECFEVFKIQE